MRRAGRRWRRSTAGALALVMLASCGGRQDPPPLEDRVLKVSQVFSEDSYWNTPLPPDAPRHPDSEAIIDFLRRDNRLDGCVTLAGAEDNVWGQPIYVAHPADPQFDVQPTRHDLPAEFASVRIPEGAVPGRNSDQEMVIYDLERGYVSWLWLAGYDEATDTWSAGGGSVAYLSSNGLHSRLEASDDPRNTGSHRGLNGAVTAVRLDEVQAGQVDRVLKIGVNTAHEGFVAPMIGSDGSTTDPDAPLQGARLRIRPDIDLDAFDLHPQARPIVQAMQDYGLVVGDSTGAGIVLKLEDTVTEGRGQLWDLATDALCDVPIDAFEVIEYGYTPPPP